MTFKVKKSGSFSDPAAVKRKASGSWTDVGFVKVKKGGVWEQVWPLAALVSITDQTINQVAPTATEAAYILNSTGIVQQKLGAVTSTIETWLLSGAASAYEARATLLVGDAPTGSALGTWLSLGTTRTWSLSDAVVDVTALRAELTVEIRLASSGVVQDTAYIILESERI